MGQATTAREQFDEAPVQTHSFLEHVRAVEPDIVSRLRAWCPGLPAHTSLNVRLLNLDSSHPVAVIEAQNGSAIRLLVKGRRKHDRIWQSLEAENRVLTEVGPQMHTTNSATRCPGVLAYYPDRGLLFLEMIEGVPLNELFFGLQPLRTRRNCAKLLELSGEWLAQFHALTRSHKERNPFEWLNEMFIRPGTRAAFAQHNEARSYQELGALLSRFRLAFESFRRPLCTVHGEFAHYHLLVKDEILYAVDFGSTRQGFPHEDVGFFLAFYDSLLPWRRAAGKRRMELEIQKQRFLAAYAAHSGAFGRPDQVVLAFVRILSVLTFLGRLGARDTFRRALYSTIAAAYLRSRFRKACAREITFLQNAVNKT